MIYNGGGGKGKDISFDDDNDDDDDDDDDEISPEDELLLEQNASLVVSELVTHRPMHASTCEDEFIENETLSLISNDLRVGHGFRAFCDVVAQFGEDQRVFGIDPLPGGQFRAVSERPQDSQTQLESPG